MCASSKLQLLPLQTGFPLLTNMMPGARCDAGIVSSRTSGACCDACDVCSMSEGIDLGTYLTLDIRRCAFKSVVKSYGWSSWSSLIPYVEYFRSPVRESEVGVTDIYASVNEAYDHSGTCNVSSFRIFQYAPDCLCPKILDTFVKQDLLEDEGVPLFLMKDRFCTSSKAVESARRTATGPATVDNFPRVLNSTDFIRPEIMIRKEQDCLNVI